MDGPKEGTALADNLVIKTEPVRSVDKTGDSLDNEVDNDVDNDDDQKSVGAEEEEALFVAMEKDEESKDALLPHSQPKDVKAAPKLLQSAIEQGEVPPDDSESDAEQPESTKTDAEPHHAHARVRKISYCLFAIEFLVF